MNSRSDFTPYDEQTAEQGRILTYWYRLGQQARAKIEKLGGDPDAFDAMDWLDDDDHPAWAAELWPIWQLGYEGDSCPVFAEGWRFGDIPEDGCSTDYRDQVLLRGTSMAWAQVPGQDAIPCHSFATREASDRPRRWVRGFLIGIGPDGEALLALPWLAPPRNGRYPYK